MAVDGWVLYSAPGGGDAVAREIRKASMTVFEVARLEAAMTRVAHGVPLPADVKLLRGEIWEVRVRVASRQFRMYFAHVGSGTRLCLGLVFLVKKSRKAPADAIALAEARLGTWLRSRSG